MNKKNKIKSKMKKGMTAIELVVVIGIFGIVASTTIFNFGLFRNNVRVQNLSQDIALLIKKAQTDSLAGLFPDLTGTQQGLTHFFTEEGQPSQGGIPERWAPSYGLRFSTSSNDNNKILYYFDRNQTAVANVEGDLELNPIDGDHLYTVSGAMTCINSDYSECLDLIEIKGGEFIELICINELSELDSVVGECSGNELIQSVNTVDIVFVRPDPTPYITVEENSNFPTTISDVTLHVRTPDGPKRLVTLFRTGQISVR